MPSMTLLDMTQDILSDLDSDVVNDIDDTVESQQVAQIIKTTYFHIIDGKDWSHLKQFIQLEAATAANPTHMKVPDNVIDVDWIKYNVKKAADTFDKYTEITYKTPKEFMALLDVRKSDASDIDVITDTTGVTLNISNDTAPTFYTSFDDEYVVFDSYDSAIDTTNLLSSKTKSYGKVEPSWTHSNVFVPDLPQQAFSYLLNEAKSTAFVVLKQSENPKAESNSQIQGRRMSQEANKIKNGITFPNYGRTSKK